MTARTPEPIPGWDHLRHTGLLLDGSRLHALSDHVPGPLDEYAERRLRRLAAATLGAADDPASTTTTSRFVAFVLEQVCGFDEASGNWRRGSQIPTGHGRRAVTGETVKPQHLWTGPRGASLLVFIDDAKRIGIGRGRRIVSQVLGWLRAGGEHLALVTNGRQWRLVFAGLDYDASCEWDAELWFEEGELGPQVTALRTLLHPTLWTPADEDAAAPPLLQAVRDTRKGQADLSEVLGERVREAVEILVQSHGEALTELAAGDDGAASADIYRAACRIAMRAVVVLFAESRDLLPRDNPVYFESYGLNGLFDQLERRDARGESMNEVFGAWPRVLSLFRLVNDGSHHPDLPVTAYGGDLFAPGRADSPDGVSRALNIFETACFGSDIVSDRNVHDMLHLLTRTRARIRQGRGGMWVTVPVDFTDLSSEYIGIVYEGLLDYELKTAPAGDPVVFLSVGDRPALPLSRLEAMDDKAVKALFEKLKKDASDKDGGAREDSAGDALEAEDEEPAEGAELADDVRDARRGFRTRAEQWARRAAGVAGLVRKPRGRMTPERRLSHEQKVADTARKLVHQHVLPGEWYLARWGGTRKGSGSFYTRPGLSVPTVQRTLRPLAYDPPAGLPEEEARHAPAAEWTPKLPEDILALKVCDPACGSGSFVLAALRFLTEALYASLRHHGRIEASGGRSLVRMLGIEAGTGGEAGESLSDEQIPCPPDAPDFEPRIKARLRRHVVERCIYAVDLDPLAVELCRLSLWIETMDRELPFGFLDHKVKCGNALVGAWFDQFQHYPAMAWKNREGGDKNHSNGVHFKKNARGKAIKAFHKDRLTPDMKRFLEGRTLFQEDLLEAAATAHEDALDVLAYMHGLPVHDAAERADVYRSDLLGSPEWRSLKDAMDLWCACWFWPPDEIDHAPMPTSFADPPEETRAVASEVSARHRFFHWELEFPDVFDETKAGFDAVVGNPPWDIAKPVSMEFFSNIDPLYRSYGKQEALKRQTEYFEDETVERAWLDYCADFRAQSNYVGRARNPFGDPKLDDKSQNKFVVVRGKRNAAVHDRWRDARYRSLGYADPRHPFRHQGSADLNLYKLFLETAHALARDGGRIGFLVPSGLYSDNGTGALRTLFLEHCRWEWLFGIENRQKIFPIDGRSKFNPVIVEKGGSTEAIQTAFMRRSLEDWERAENIATPYAREQVERFSPKSRAILEIQSRRDLEILEKIYASSVLLGDDGPDGWGIKYATEFHMTNDSKLFPPRPKWEAKGYRPDEYSRWLKGDWRPVGELWAELGVDPARPEPAEIELEDWLFDTSADPERRAAEARLAHGHLLKPGDVARTDWTARCAQPPYDRLPVPRAAIPPGMVLSRDATEWIREEGVEDEALPLYEGRMIGQFDFSEKGWVSGKGRGAVWREIPWEQKQIEPQFLMGVGDYRAAKKACRVPKTAYMRISSTTNTRTTISSYLGCHPAGDSVFFFVPSSGSVATAAVVASVFSSFAFDWAVRQRLVGLNMSEFVMVEAPLPHPAPHLIRALLLLYADLGFGHPSLAAERMQVSRSRITPPAALAPRRRVERIAMINAIAASALGYGDSELDTPWGAATCYGGVPRSLLPMRRASGESTRTSTPNSATPSSRSSRSRTSNRTSAQLPATATPESSHSSPRTTARAGSCPKPSASPTTASATTTAPATTSPSPPASGPRFYDWQLAQSPHESRRECRLHAPQPAGGRGVPGVDRGRRTGCGSCAQ